MNQFDVSEYLRLLRQRGCAIGDPFEFRHVTGSTNDDAKRAAREGCVVGATFLADEQTGGRGRRGRQWVSNAGEALLFSVVVRPRLRPQELSNLTLAVGLGVREALARHCAPAPRLKWPNDVLCGDKKLAGILVEADTSSASVVIGVGINVDVDRFPSDLELSATSLRQCGTPPARESLLVEVLAEVATWMAALEGGGLQRVVRELQHWDALAGRAIEVDGVSGTARGIDANGHLLLEVDGHTRAVRSGTVVFR